MNPIAYVFGSPGDASVWQQQVSAAIGRQDLRWWHVVDTQWTLAGTCPRCSDPTAQYLDLAVVVADTIAVTEYAKASAPDMVSIEFVCLCDADPPHRKDTKGCGAGRGLLIEVARPTVEAKVP